jgi:hypothetical protein
MKLSSETRAFPAYLATEVESVIQVLSDYQSLPPSDTFASVVQGERIEIPYRVYYRESQVLKCAERLGIQGRIAQCLGTRHHDGFLREKCLKQVIAVDEAWVAPFIAKLVGEYILQIIQIIEHELPNLNVQMYGEFLGENA